MLFMRETEEGIRFKVFVLPRSSKNMVSGLHGDALKLKLTAPPVDGSANKMCVKFLAKLFKTAKSDISIESGESSRTKQILVRVAEGDRAGLENAKKILASLIS